MSEKRFEDGAGKASNERVDVTQMHAPIYREHGEPEDGYEPLPTFWLMCMIALALWGGWYLGTYAAHFSGDVLDGGNFEEGAKPVAVAAAPVDPKVLGKRIFNNCMACHQADGKGVPAQFPPLAGSEWVLSDERVLARILLHGMHEPVTVLNKTYEGAMPAWNRLPDAQIAAVLTYIRSSWGNSAGEIAPDTIRVAREQTASRKGPFNASELTQLAQTP